MAASSNARKPLEKDIQASIMKFLSTKKKTIYWRQNSGSFSAMAIRAAGVILSRYGISAVLKNAMMGALKKAVGHYTCTSEVGLPDISVVYRGVYLGLEVKKHDGVQNKDQKIMQDRMTKSGARYYIVRSVDDVRAILEETDKAFVVVPDEV